MADEFDLILKYKTGDDSSLEELVSLYQGRLFTFFRRLGAKIEDAEDLVQETFVKVIRHIDTYKPEAKFSAYIYRIAKNGWIDFLRKKGRAHESDITKENEDFFNQLAISREKTPVEHSLRKEMETAIEEALERLSDEQKMVVVLSDYENMKYREIAETLEIPIGTVKSRIHAAYKNLHEILSPFFCEVK